MTGNEVTINPVNTIFQSLEPRSNRFWVATAIASIGLLGAVDFLTGVEVSFSLFYLAPIASVSWFVTRRLGLTMSVLSSITWLVAELAAGQTYSQTVIYFWNTLIRFGFFVIVTYLVAALRASHDAQRALARTDHISGAVNALYFHEVAQMEILRSRRSQQPLTLAYMDLDNFKQVNDLFGHNMGDDVLRLISTELKSRLRSTDTIARLGGDEFALLLPDTGQAEAQVILSRVHAELTHHMQQKKLPVTFSIGAVICVSAPDSVEDLIQVADELMYDVKNSTKNAVRFIAYARPPSSP